VSPETLLDWVWLIPAFPLLGATVLLFFGRRIGEPRAGHLATAMVALSFLGSVVAFLALVDLSSHDRVHVSTLFTWIPAGAFQVEASAYVDPLSVAFLLFVTGVATLIHLYAIGYMHGDPGFGRFFCYLNLFLFSMIMLVLGGNFLVMFVGWEGVGLCSYLLVSFWYERTRAAVAGKKAFVTNRIGDFGFMLAMFLIVAELGTLEFGPALAGADTLAGGTATAIALLFFLGAVGKSAQIPLHVWLPDAMEGPTPVSALIHAATMVTAGVYLVARAHPFFEASGGSAMTTVAWVGVATALIAGTVAIVQFDIKRVLAYSTISQLGYMFLALGIGAYSSAIFLVICHAFYKGTLFLGAGSVIHGVGDHQDLRTMGKLRRFLPFTAIGFIVAWLTIAGMPPFSGFWAKDDVLAKAFYANDYALWAIGVAAAALTALYMTRETYLVFFGNKRFEAAEVTADVAPAVATEPDPTESPTVDAWDPPVPARLAHEPHESPPTMVLAILVLGTLAAVAGVLNLPFQGIEFLAEWLEPVFEGAPELTASSFAEGAALSTISVTFGLVGIGIGISLYRRGLPAPDADPLPRRLGRTGQVLQHAYYFDEGLARVVGGPLRRVADWLAGPLDQGVVDGAVNGVAVLVRRLAGGLRRVQTGFVRSYALVFLFGTAVLLVIVAVRVGT
jgi:NADH-quinone oxidoreductase subunit L